MTAPTSELSQTIQQHLGWLKMYVEGMTSENWRDMRDRCSAQLVGLSQDLARVREEERERCAKIAEEHIHIDKAGQAHEVWWFARSVAQAIRSTEGA